jgi:radical SAM superfamily enzyme YgiQ (UPF0313 family)
MKNFTRAGAVKVCKSIKKISPETITVYEGVHATFMREKILSSIPVIDIIVLYEGEHHYE